MERWITQKTSQVMHDGTLLPTVQVVIDQEDGSPGAIVARVHALGPDRLEEVERRGHLIKAAPRLLEALVALNAAMAAQVVGAPLPPDLIAEYQRQADLAVAAAEGR